jgi:hypothetical protein
MIVGVPLLTSREATVGTIWGLSAERVVTAVRRDAEVQADRSDSSPRIGLPSGPPAGSVRLPHSAALVRIRLAAS